MNASRSELDGLVLLEVVGYQLDMVWFGLEALILLGINKTNSKRNNRCALQTVNGLNTYRVDKKRVITPFYLYLFNIVAAVSSTMLPFARTATNQFMLCKGNLGFKPQLERDQFVVDGPEYQRCYKIQGKVIAKPREKCKIRSVKRCQP